MKMLWLTDPWGNLDHERDTTLRLIEAARLLGHVNYLADARELLFEHGGVAVRARHVLDIGRPRSEKNWKFEETVRLDIRYFEQVHYRLDPPIDARFWEPLQLLALECTEVDAPEMVNPLPVLMQVSEKLGLSLVSKALPPTIVSASWEELRGFGLAECSTVLKPMGNAQGRSVEFLKWTSPSEIERSRNAIELLSQSFSRPVVLQKFLEAVYHGEKRLWFVDGNLLAFVNKRPAPGKFIIDVDNGAFCEPCDLGEREVRLATQLGTVLRDRGIRLAAVDLIGGFITDFNVTSPGMIPLMEAVLERNLAEPIIRSIASCQSNLIAS